VTFSSVFVEDIIKRFTSIPEKIEKVLYPASLIVIAILCTVYVVVVGIEHVMPFVFQTAFPCTIPNTLVALAGVRNKRTSPKAAFWAIILGVSVSLVWGLGLGDPFGLPNIYLAFFIPLLILAGDWLLSFQGQRGELLSSAE
jgi:Na+/proline symporter